MPFAPGTPPHACLLFLVVLPEIFLDSSDSVFRAAATLFLAQPETHNLFTIHDQQSHSSMKTPLVLRYFLWSMLIFAVSMICLSFRMLESLQDRALALGTYVRYGNYYQSLKEIDLPYRVVPLYEAQTSPEQYFEFVLDVSHHLKAAGAKVAIAPVPEGFRPSPRIIRIIQDIVRDSLVLFGAPNPRAPGRWQQDRPIDDKAGWWVNRPFFGQEKISWGVMTADIGSHSPLLRFAPVGFREFNSGEPVSDVATIALKRYFDIPEAEELPLLRSHYVVGPKSIQVGQDGVSLLRFTYRPAHFSELSAAFNFNSDSIQYFPEQDPYSGNKRTLEEAWRGHKGKIVMIDWYGISPSLSMSNGWLYLQVFADVFGQSFVTVHNEWNMLLITSLVVLLSVFSYVVRNGLMVFVSFLLSAATIAVSIWLFESYDVLFQPIYVIVPVVLSGVILPIVKVSGEKRIAEGRIKSLEEENQRLLDLQRSVSP